MPMHDYTTTWAGRPWVRVRPTPLPESYSHRSALYELVVDLHPASVTRRAFNKVT